MDECHGALHADHRERETHPFGEIGVALDRRPGFARRRRWGCVAAFVEWRIGHDMVEGTWREARRRMQEISDHDRGTGLETVQDHVVPGKPDEVALHF